MPERRGRGRGTRRGLIGLPKLGDGSMMELVSFSLLLNDLMVAKESFIGVGTGIDASLQK